MHDTHPIKSCGYEKTYHQEKKDACKLHVGKNINEQGTQVAHRTTKVVLACYSRGSFMYEQSLGK